MATKTEPSNENNISIDEEIKAAMANSDNKEDEESRNSAVVQIETQVVPKTKSYPRRACRDPMTVERSNLLTVFKLVTKELIDSSLSHGRMLDDDHVPLQQFFVVLEHILRHGIKPRKRILGDRTDFWNVLELVERYSLDAIDITMSVKEMTHVKTPLGRARAWLRLALMQKKLAEYISILMERKEEVLKQLYEPGAMLLEEEAMVISGLLVGLNVIDCNITIKDQDLDQPMGVIDFSLYLQDNNASAGEEEDASQKKEKMATILDQKNYLEELNGHLNATVTTLQNKMESTMTANTLMKEDLAISKNTIIELQQQNQLLQAEKEVLLQQHHHSIKSTQEDINTERETFQTSRAGLDELYEQTNKRLKDETQLRLDVEKELQLQISMKQEMEVALRLLEKDIHEKQDTVIALRQQLEDVKHINLEKFNQLQTCESSLKHKTELVVKLESKTQEMASAIAEMENRHQQALIEKQAAEETARKLGQNLADKDNKKTALETDLKIEREWRGSLQKNLESEKEKVTELHQELQRAKQIVKDYEGLQSRHMDLQRLTEEQEKALGELGSHLSESKLKVEDLREVQQVLNETKWADDSQVTNCKQCAKMFSVSRRKHHCRNCGEIFCNDCSDNKTALPSSAKPVRVCDTCQSYIEQRQSK